MAEPERLSDIPTAYLYEVEPKKWIKSDKILTAEINAHIFHNHDFNPAGREFYPQWPEPRFKTKTHPAWKLDKTGARVIRTKRIETDHHKSHAACRQLGNGKCEQIIAERLGWDSKAKIWTRIDDSSQ